MKIQNIPENEAMVLLIISAALRRQMATSSLAGNGCPDSVLLGTCSLGKGKLWDFSR